MNTMETAKLMIATRRGDRGSRPPNVTRASG